MIVLHPEFTGTTGLHAQSLKNLAWSSVHIYFQLHLCDMFHTHATVMFKMQIKERKRDLIFLTHHLLDLVLAQQLHTMVATDIPMLGTERRQMKQPGL